MEYVVERLDPAMAARGGAALSTTSLTDLSLRKDDCISITEDGGTYAFARVREGTNDDGRLPTVALDPYLRGQLDVEPGDRVSVEPAAVADAQTVDLNIPDILFFQGSDNRTRQLLRTRLRNRPLVEDRPVMIALEVDDEGVDQHFPVRPTDIDPAGPAVVTEDTTITIKQDEYIWSPSDATTHQPVSFEDIGGLDDELEQVREMVELPMNHPELFERLNIDPPGGVLLHGPPGTGKTLIARAIAEKLDASFVHLDGPEIQRPRKGMAEAVLRDAFERARDRAPAVVFIDEIDAIAPDRDGRTVGQSDSKIVAQLLTLLDGLEENEDVTVIGATNRLDTIDPALRRSGRFDREIEIGIPGERARREILDVHTRHVPLAPAVDLGDYAERTHGFVGADLEMLITEAGMNALQRIRPEIGLSDEPLSAAALEQIEVSVADMDQALTEVEPSAMRDYVVEVPSVTWDDVGGLEQVKSQLREVVQWPLQFGSAFRTLDVEPSSGMLLYGPPGTGKTLLAKAAANETNSNFISVKGPELLESLVGESEANVRELFETARANAPCIVFFDEIDAIATERDGHNLDAGVTDRMVSQLLAELDGIDTLENVFVVATTNRFDLIDEALLRPGRLDYQLEVPLPDAEARREIFAVHTQEKSLADGVDVDSFADRTDGYSGAAIASVCREAALGALRDVVEAVPANEVDKAVESVALTQQHFKQALETVETDESDDVGGSMTY